jgi:hypothetical protein
VVQDPGLEPSTNTTKKKKKKKKREKKGADKNPQVMASCHAGK